jgi:hypothetical protein
MKVCFVDSSVIFKYMIIAVFMYEYDKQGGVGELIQKIK